jgi:hypothetical protein
VLVFSGYVDCAAATVEVSDLDGDDPVHEVVGVGIGRFGAKALFQLKPANPGEYLLQLGGTASQRLWSLGTMRRMAPSISATTSGDSWPTLLVVVDDDVSRRTNAWIGARQSLRIPPFCVSMLLRELVCRLSGKRHKEALHFGEKIGLPRVPFVQSH